MNLLQLVLSFLRGLFGGIPAAGDPPAPTSSDLLPQEPPQAAGQPVNRRINSDGLAIVKSVEGLRLVAYQDSVGVWTIGYGHTKNVSRGMVISLAQAEAFLELDILDAETAVNALAPRSLTDNQFSALVDFTFNEGEGGLRQLLAHGIDQIPAQILRWDFAGGVPVAGLEKRRQEDLALWEAA